MKYLILFAFISVAGQIGYGQHNMPSQINNLVKNYTKTHSAKGLVIGIIHKDKSIVKGYGEISKDQPFPPNGNSLFDLGAVSEIFTTTLMVHESYQGHIDIMSRVQEYLPKDITMPSFDPLACKDVAEYDPRSGGIELNQICETSPFTSKKCITFCDLASHSSGLSNVPRGLFGWNPFKYIQNHKDPFKTLERIQLFESLDHSYLNYEPGKFYSHSSWGIALLGQIIAEVNHKPYGTVLRQELLKPLDMNETFTNVPEEKQSLYLVGHDRNGKPFINPQHFNAMTPALGLKSSVNDLITFLKGHLNIESSSKDLFSAMAATHDPVIDTRKRIRGKSVQLGYGWFISPIESDQSIPAVWIHGGTKGFSSFVGFVKSTQTAVVVLSNSQNSVTELSFEILELLHESLKNSAAGQ